MTIAELQQAIIERARNVLVDASAGTGKTWLLVERLVELVAPQGDLPAIPIDRIAAITFTRKAAGELRVRARQRLLETLGAEAHDTRRAHDVRAALTGLDTAQLATIHGFADHLLRKWPAHMRMDPHYELEDHEANLHRACFDAIMQAAETGTLAARLSGSAVAERVDEATATLLAIERAGLRTRSREAEHWTYHGLDNLIAAFAIHRDVEVADPPMPSFDRATFLRFADEYLQRVALLTPATAGSRWLREVGTVVEQVMHDTDPAMIHGQLAFRLKRRSTDKLLKKRDFPGDEAGWNVWKALDGVAGKPPVRERALYEDILAPLRHWLAVRLVRLRPIVLRVYEQVKAERRAVDHLDLVLRLRDLLRDEPQIRAHCQGLYDHLLVDELQDTDPVQAELIALLGGSPSSPLLAPGKLTLVGDPKQSIYRFRRADIATYDQLRGLAERGPCLPVELTVSRRSTPPLVDWINQRFTELMDVPDGARFSSATGEVRYQPLAHGRTGGVDPAVHAVPLVPGADDLADATRQLEADAMARYVRWLVHTSEVAIRDPRTDELRRIRYGDVGVLALSTTTLPLLFDAFDRDGVPYAARGGTLFLDDALHRQFLLGLCAIADRDDGVALTAVLRPPFFALDLGDLARASDAPDDRAARARDIVRELRRRRFERSPGATARALIEDTAIGRVVALGANGQQRLRGLYELCHQLELHALDGVDFDRAVEALRRWLDEPPQLDRPLPVTGDTVRAMTVHQAKGLEFPVVVLWDARAVWSEPLRHEVWTAAPDGAWDLRLDALPWTEPHGSQLVARERKFRDAERKRLVYVAATRARDLLVIPRLVGGEDKQIFHRLLGSSNALVHDAAPHAAAAPAPWYIAATPAPPPVATNVSTCEHDAAWNTSAAQAARLRHAPRGFARAHSARAWWGMPGRHGTAFGHTVHVAIGRVLLANASYDDAVALAASRCALVGHRAEAVTDVRRALEALRGWLVPGQFRLEYPIAGTTGDHMFAGYIDLVADLGEQLAVIDFKTDLPPETVSAIPTAYRDQVCGYASSLGKICHTTVRAGLLFTADGGIRWLT